MKTLMKDTVQMQVTLQRKKLKLGLIRNDLWGKKFMKNALVLV